MVISSLIKVRLIEIRMRRRIVWKATPAFWLGPLFVFWLSPVTGAAQPLVNPFAGNPQAAADGAKVFLTSCATCHGKTGEGAEAQVEGLHPPDLTRGEFRAGKGDDDLFRVISEGVQ